MFPTRFFNVRAFARRFFPKVGADSGPVTPTGAISADGTENYIGGSTTISALAGSATISTIGGSISGSVFGGSIS
jgi:hypothetical protein